MAKETLQERIARINSMMGGAPQPTQSASWNVDPNANVPTTATPFDRSALEKQYEGYTNPASLLQPKPYQMISYDWEVLPDGTRKPKPMIDSATGQIKYITKEIIDKATGLPKEVPILDKNKQPIPDFATKMQSFATEAEAKNEFEKAAQWERARSILIDPENQYGDKEIRKSDIMGGMPSPESINKIQSEAAANKAEIDAAINKFANEGGAGYTQAQLDAIREANLIGKKSFEQASGANRPSALQELQQMIGGDPNISASGVPILQPSYASGEGKKGTLKIGALKGLSAPEYPKVTFSTTLAGKARPTPGTPKPTIRVADTGNIGLFNSIKDKDMTTAETIISTQVSWFDTNSKAYKDRYNANVAQMDSIKNFAAEIAKYDKTDTRAKALLDAYDKLKKTNFTVWGTNDTPSVKMSQEARNFLTIVKPIFLDRIKNNWDDSILKDETVDHKRIEKEKGRGYENLANEVLANVLSLAALRRVASINQSDIYNSKTPTLDKPAGAR